ncbi:MAG: higB-2 1 [Mucilaginibacter sp.]|nr:higB-2 1 [Mucilaginibacter sp.]
MANNIRVTEFFLRKVKRLVKKYHSLESSIYKLQQELIENPKQGDSYGANIYKIRLADESKGKGKSGGFRVITYLIQKSEESTNIYLITIFDKSEEESIDKKDVLEIIKSIKDSE